MSLRRTFATTGRVLTQILHDARTIVMLLIMPSLLIGLMAWIFDNTSDFNNIGPSVLGLFPFTVMFLVTSISTLRERRSGTLERLLSMPISKFDFIFGYGLTFSALAVIQASIAVTVAVWVCGLSITGSVWLLLVVALADALLGISLGLLASAFAQTEFQVVQFMPVFVFPQILLGGFLIPRDQMPDALHTVSDWLPLSYAVDALNGVADGSDVGTIVGDVLVIVAFAAGAIILGSLTLRRRTS